MQTESANSAGNSNNEGGQSAVDAKILADLNVVKEKMDLCHSMMNPGDGSPAPSLKNNEALLGVIGFLEACAPRMVDLVQAAAQGALSEPTLMECLQVNDRLVKQLEDIDTFAFTETPAATTAATPAVESIDHDLDDLLLDDDDKPKGGEAEKATEGKKTTGMVDDPFGTDVLAPAPAANATTTGGDTDPFGNTVLAPTAAAAENTLEKNSVPAAAKDEPKDDFDAFFEERTSK